ncbi:MAG: hypothetical protein HC780_27505, partial [Leptolyngbyaceae cyanobacterium CSU_1_3]|nr:hypothetical protein [Leptolyngbyaceae cyanobacterium CSU_1_3]
HPRHSHSHCRHRHCGFPVRTPLVDAGRKPQSFVRSDVGSLRYQVHLPRQFDGTTQLLVMMAIHGCGMTGYGWNTMKSTTQFNRVADSEGFIVVYPTQRLFRNMINCWNSTDPREQHRYSGEPALLAGVARQSAIASPHSSRAKCPY